MLLWHVWLSHCDCPVAIGVNLCGRWTNLASASPRKPSSLGLIPIRFPVSPSLLQLGVQNQVLHQHWLSSVCWPCFWWSQLHSLLYLWGESGVGSHSTWCSCNSQLLFRLLIKIAVSTFGTCVPALIALLYTLMRTPLLPGNCFVLWMMIFLSFPIEELQNSFLASVINQTPRLAKSGIKAFVHAIVVNLYQCMQLRSSETCLHLSYWLSSSEEDKHRPLLYAGHVN